RSDRPQLARALRKLDTGDVLMVVRLDRLARSTRDLLNVLAEIGKRHAAFRSLGDAWADTTTPHGKLMVTVLGGLAEFERALIAARTGEGRKRAMARGVKFGRACQAYVASAARGVAADRSRRDVCGDRALARRARDDRHAPGHSAALRGIKALLESVPQSTPAGEEKRK